MSVGVAETLGNEGIVLEYSIFRVDMDIEDQFPAPDWSGPFEVVKECLGWIRVATRQYWIGILSSGSNSIARGSIISAPGEWTNFGAAQTPFHGEWLSNRCWQWVGAQINAGKSPSIPDLMFCDALLSFRAHDYLQSAVRLGIVCELELNSLIDDLLARQSEVAQKLYKEKAHQFGEKLTTTLEILGAQSYRNHNEQWATELCKLYPLRGSAIHHAECLINGVPVGFEHISRFVFAVDDFLHWAKYQRTQLGL
jgi:hypothetical protein